MTPTCLVCGAAAVVWCDHVIGIFNHGERILRSMDVDPKDVVVCDAPMCGEHGVGVGFVSGRQPDTINMCPVHHGAVSANPGDADWTKTYAQLGAMRQQAWAENRRAGMRLANPSSGEPCGCAVATTQDGFHVQVTCPSHQRST